MGCRTQAAEGFEVVSDARGCEGTIKCECWDDSC